MNKQHIINKYIKGGIYDFVIDSAIPTLKWNGLSVPFWKHDDSVNDGMKMIEHEENGEKQYEPHPASPLTYYNFDLVGVESPEIGLDYEEEKPSSWLSVRKKGNYLSFRFKNRTNNVIYQFYYENWKGRNLSFKFHEKEHLVLKENKDDVEYAQQLSMIHSTFLFDKLRPSIPKEKLIVWIIPKHTETGMEWYDTPSWHEKDAMLEVGKEFGYQTFATSPDKDVTKTINKNGIGLLIAYPPKENQSKGIEDLFKKFGQDNPMAIFIDNEFKTYGLPKLTTKGSIGAVTHHIHLPEYIAFRRNYFPHLFLFNFNQIVYEDLKFDKEKDDFIEQAIRKNNMFKTSS